jgi:hypothetical protein
VNANISIKRRPAHSIPWPMPSAWNPSASPASRRKPWPEEQAKLIDERLATKQDIDALRLAAKEDSACVRADIEQLALRLEARLAETKADILKWMFGNIGVQTIALLATLFTSVRLAHN